MRLVLVAALLAAAPAIAQEVVSRERTMQLQARSGEPLRVRNYAFWRRDCSPNGVPRIAIRTAPAHGTLDTPAAVSTVREVREGTGPGCLGAQIPGTAVIYTPEPGFHGTDRFDYDVIGTSTAHDTVVVDVR